MNDFDQTRREQEEGILLRAGALFILNDIADHLAGYHAARLMVDPHSDDMSGEPALTAVRILGSQDQILVLFMYAMSGSGTLPEVTSECLRNLTGIPTTLLPAIIGRFKDTKNSAILVGLYDLLLEHEEGPQALDFLEESLLTLSDLDLYHYLVIALMTRREAALTNLVLRSARFETDPGKIDLLREILALFKGDPAVSDTVARLAKRSRKKPP
ncbi:MAG: hypothetical protein U9R25_04440 [Chloroflexota bacterium]|nr:hypothetical protein [Chloroflexota bacterium]